MDRYIPPRITGDQYAKAKAAREKCRFGEASNSDAREPEARGQDSRDQRACSDHRKAPEVHPGPRSNDSRYLEGYFDGVEAYSEHDGPSRMLGLMIILGLVAFCAFMAGLKVGSVVGQ